MKKSLSLLLLTLVLQYPTFSQTGAEDHPDFRRNEFWLDFSSIREYNFLENQPWNLELGLTFKRYMGKHWLRVGAFIKPFNDFYDENQYYNVLNDTLIVHNFLTTMGLSTGGRLGLEARKDFNLFTGFVGADVIFKYTDLSFHANAREMIVDSISPLPERYYYFSNSMHSPPDILFTERYILYGGGLSGLAGLSRILTNRISVAVQVRLDMIYLSGNIRSRDFQTDITGSSNYSEFQLNSRLFGHLIYRF